MISPYHFFKLVQKKKNRTKVDSMMTVAGVLAPLTALPQAVMLYTTKETAGLSISMWVSLMGLGVIFLLYGIAHKLKPYIVMQSLWLLMDAIVIAGILIYR